MELCWRAFSERTYAAGAARILERTDRYMVLEQGRMIERGTHDELIERKGKYDQLYTGNFAEELA